MSEIKGIDISYHQGDAVDFAKVKASGVEFVIIRAGYRGYGTGTLKLDGCFINNINKAITAGLKVGVYFFSQAINAKEGAEEATFVLNAVQGYKLDYPIFIDTEGSGAQSGETGRADGITKANRTAAVGAFCEAIEKAGYFAGIYASRSWYTDKLTDSKLTQYAHWVAEYNDTCKYAGTIGMWQYSSKGKVDGISGNVDMNIDYTDYASVIAKAGLNKVAETPKVETPVAPTKSVEELAKEVIEGKHGNGEERKKSLGSQYDAVQARVNELLSNQTAPVKTYKQGDSVVISNKALYATSMTTVSSNRLNGTFYLYDGEKMNGRYKVTTKKEFCGKTPIGRYVTGWVIL